MQPWTLTHTTVAGQSGVHSAGVADGVSLLDDPDGRLRHVGGHPTPVRELRIRRLHHHR